MINFDSTHIFIGYLKQLLSTFNLPTSRIYTKEFAQYLSINGKEDPRVLESFDTMSNNRLAARINYLKNDSITNYFWETKNNSCQWKKCSTAFYEPDKTIPGLTKTLNSPGGIYDTATHEYLGDYLRFLRDYYNTDLMSLYNCFNNKLCNNIYFNNRTSNSAKTHSIVFNSQDPDYHIYAIPVKLFQKYTIAIDCTQSIEMFCGLYNTRLDDSQRTADLISKTYTKVTGAIFKQPFLFDKLSDEHWAFDITNTSSDDTLYQQLQDKSIITKWDIVNREQDLKLFIKVPTTCKSSIVILEGDYRFFNDAKYTHLIEKSIWKYEQNHCAINFENKKELDDPFVPIHKLQLLAFNVNKSYPFADRLIEYLCGSAITPTDKIADNIKRVQKVMEQNNYYFKLKGLWEPKMQKIIYDYIVNSGPITRDASGKLKDRHSGFNPNHYGYHPRLGHTSKSTLYDVLGYVDKDAEKWYSSWKLEDNKVVLQDNIQNVDIYNGLFDV